MPKTLIQQFPDFKKSVNVDDIKIDVAELFCNTVQGEGIHTGVVSSFLRLQHCTLSCVWCDTLEVWKKGNPYSIKEIFDLLIENDMVDRFRAGQHFVLTGGSVLRQEFALLQFFREFNAKFGFNPHYEVENEVVLMPSEEFCRFISTWNNSPKLSNSAMKERLRYKPEIIKATANLKNSWFKFVVQCDEDWEEINEFFLIPQLISRDQIIIMPEGQTQQELSQTRDVAVEMAIKHNVRFCDRLHITIWDKKTGV